MPAYLTQAYHSLKVQGQTKDIMSLVEVVTYVTFMHGLYIADGHTC